MMTRIDRTKFRQLQTRGFALLSALLAFYAPHVWSQQVSLKNLRVLNAAPLLTPSGEGWQAQSVSDATAIVEDSTVFLFFETRDRTGAGIWNGTSRIALVVMQDSLRFASEAQPVLEPTRDVETPGGCRGPRVTKIDSLYLMTYSAYDGFTQRLALARSADLRTWHKLGLLFPDSSNTQAGVIIPRKIRDSYAMYYSDGGLRLAFSSDLQQWHATLHRNLVSDLADGIASTVIPGPLWLANDRIFLLCNFISDDGHYRYVVLNFALNNPVQVLSTTSLALESNKATATPAQLLAVTGLSTAAQKSWFYVNTSTGIEVVASITK